MGFSHAQFITRLLNPKIITSLCVFQWTKIHKQYIEWVARMLQVGYDRYIIDIGRYIGIIGGYIGIGR